LLPKKYWGQPLHTDAGPRHLRCYHLTPDGAGYAVDREDMVTSQDDWFRPSDVCVAPDGSVYIADWYDPGVGGHNMGDVQRGRIYRVAPRGNKPSVPKVDLDGKEGLTAALASPALSVRYMAMAQLRRMKPAEALAVLEPAARQKQDVWLRARALWQLARLGSRGKKYVADAFGDADARFRVMAVRLEKDYSGDSPADYSVLRTKALVSDPSGAVRREALLALRDVAAPKARPTILQLAKCYRGNDRFYLEAIGIAVGRDENRRHAILADFAKEFPEWSDRVADLVWELRPPQLLPVLEERLADAKLPVSQRQRLIEILLSYADVSAGKSLLKALSVGLPPDLRQNIVDHLKLSLSGKWQDLRQSAELTSTIDRLLAKSQTRATGVALIAAAHKADACAAVAAIAEDAKETAATRAAAVQTLGLLPGAEPRTSLQKLVLGADRGVSIQQSATAALAGSRQGSIWLLDLYKKKLLPAALKPDVATLLRNSPYDDLRKQALAAFPPPGRLDPARLPSIAALAQRHGNPDRGKHVMANNKDLRCLACHTVRGAGGHVGPDLSMIGKKASRQNLFESILFPSKAVANEYLNWIIETKDGLSLTGLIVEETADHVTLRDANGKDTRLGKADIESRTKSPNSLMPNDLLAYMTEDDLVDIVSYLYTLKTPSLAMDYWHICGPFDNGTNDAGLDRVFPPEKAIDLKATYQGKSGAVAWRQVKPDEKGYVDLQAFLGKDSPDSVSYLYREVESPADQDAKVLLGPDDGAKLWVNGQMVYTSRLHRPAAPEADTVMAKLKKGRNKLLLKINNGNDPHGFYLTIEAEQELKAR
jgi:putative heme-binding domain-containing protein